MNVSDVAMTALNCDDFSKLCKIGRLENCFIQSIFTEYFASNNAK